MTDPIDILLEQFQFHKGTIKTIFHEIVTLLLHHFNSIKVRLKHGGLTYFVVVKTFQFHKGTIKTQISLFIYDGTDISIP